MLQNTKKWQRKLFENEQNLQHLGGAAPQTPCFVIYKPLETPKNFSAYAPDNGFISMCQVSKIAEELNWRLSSLLEKLDDMTNFCPVHISAPVHMA